MQKDLDERSALERFLFNEGHSFDETKFSKGKIEPCDVVYDDKAYQVTYGDQHKEAEFRSKMSKYGSVSMFRSIDLEDWPKIAVGDALQKKSYMDGHGIVLLIRVTSSGPYTEEDMKIKIFEFVSQHTVYLGSWDNIYAVFHDFNIKIK